MDVSVIVVNYNTKSLTRQCLDSIFNQTFGVTFEVILVDNASSDGSIELFRKDKRVHLVESDTNIGFGKANNLGFLSTKGKYVFLLNSDTILLNNVLKLFYDKMETAGPEIGCVGCLLQDVNGQYVHSYADFPCVENMIGPLIWPSLFSCLGLNNWKMDPYMKEMTKCSFFRVGYVTGADLFIRRNVIEKCGFFDSDFFMYYEDTELQWRFVKHGISSYIYNAPKIVHLEGYSSRKRSSHKYLMIFESMLRYMSKTQNFWLVLLLRLFLFMKAPYMIIRLGLNLRETIKYLSIIIGHY